jgi:hypothetical protein
MTASLFALARENGLERVDHVVLSVDSGQVKKGENVFVVQGGLTDVHNRVAYMKTAEAVSVSPDVSLERAAQVGPVHVQQHDQPGVAQAHAPPALSIAR